MTNREKEKTGHSKSKFEEIGEFTEGIVDIEILEDDDASAHRETTGEEDLKNFNEEILNVDAGLNEEVEIVDQYDSPAEEEIDLGSLTAEIDKMTNVEKKPAVDALPAKSSGDLDIWFEAAEKDDLHDPGSLGSPDAGHSELKEPETIAADGETLPLDEFDRHDEDFLILQDTRRDVSAAEESAGEFPEAGAGQTAASDYEETGNESTDAPLSGADEAASDEEIPEVDEREIAAILDGDASDGEMRVTVEDQPAIPETEEITQTVSGKKKRDSFTIEIPDSLQEKLPDDFDIEGLGKIDLREAEEIANENVLFLTEDDLVEELEDFDLTPVDEPLPGKADIYAETPVSPGVTEAESFERENDGIESTAQEHAPVGMEDAVTVPVQEEPAAEEEAGIPDDMHALEEGMEPEKEYPDEKPPVAEKDGSAGKADHALSENISVQVDDSKDGTVPVLLSEEAETEEFREKQGDITPEKPVKGTDGGTDEFLPHAFTDEESLEPVRETGKEIPESVDDEVEETAFHEATAVSAGRRLPGTESRSGLRDEEMTALGADEERGGEPVPEKTVPGAMEDAGPADFPIRKEEIPGELLSVGRGMNNVFIIDDEGVNREERSAEELFEENELEKMSTELVEVSETSSILLEEADLQEDQNRVASVMRGTALAFEDLLIDFDEEYTFVDDELDFIEKRLMEEVFSGVMVEKEESAAISRKQDTHAREILGLSEDEIDDIQNNVIYADYRDVVFGIPAPEERKGEEKPKKCLYRLPVADSLTPDEKGSIEEDIVADSAFIYEEPVELIRRKLDELVKRKKERSEESVIDITDDVVIIGSEEDIQRFIDTMPEEKREDLRKLLKYIDDLFVQLPEEVIRRFIDSEYFNIYSSVLSELGISAGDAV